MKIVDKTPNSKMRPFEWIKPGDCAMRGNGKIVMRTFRPDPGGIYSSGDRHRPYLAAVEVETGQVVIVGRCEAVTPVNAQVVVERSE